MKRLILNSIMNFIKDNRQSITETQLEEVEYGLEGIYLTITKMIIIFSLAAILGIFKEVIMLSIFYNMIRCTAFGIHATKSSYCLITSIIMFIGGVYICNYLSLNLIIKFLIASFCLLCIFKYAPADTYKRPLINAKKRKRYKLISFISGSIFTILIIIYSNNIISNYLLVGMIESVIMIHPITYKLFKLPYDNYKNYKLGLSN